MRDRSKPLEMDKKFENKVQTARKGLENLRTPGANRSKALNKFRNKEQTASKTLELEKD